MPYIVEGIVGEVVGDLFVGWLAILIVFELASRYAWEDRLLYAAGGVAVVCSHCRFVRDT